MANLLNDFPTSGTSGGAAFNVAVYIIISMLVLVGIVYLISRVLRKPKLEDWARHEFLQVMISAAIVGGLAVLMMPQTGIITRLFDTLVPSDTLNIYLASDSMNMSSSSVNATQSVISTGCSLTSGIADGTLLCYSYNYLGLLELQILNLVQTIFFTNVIIDILSKVAIDLIIVSVTPLSGLSSVAQVLSTIMQSLIMLGIVVGIEMTFLQFISKVALTIFLPLGAILRCFFGTRRLGGFLIALSVGMYCILPAAIALGAISVQQLQFDALSPIVHYYDAVMAVDPFNQFTNPGDFTNVDRWSAYLTGFPTAGKEILDAILSLPKSMVSVIAILVVQVVLLPILTLMITAVAVKELGVLFGAEIDLGKFGV